MANAHIIFYEFPGNTQSARSLNSNAPQREIVHNNIAGKMWSNKITAIRLANLVEQDDPGVHDLIDFDLLKLYGTAIKGDAELKKVYVRRPGGAATVHILNAVEEGSKVAVHFDVEIDGNKSSHFHIYRFNDRGLLIEAWIDK